MNPTRPQPTPHPARRPVLALLALAVLTFFVGTAWDVQWHVSVGRDKVFTAPHLAMLGGIGLAGLASLTLILLETLTTRRHPDRPTHGTARIGPFRAPAGIIVAGFGALLAAIAFPLDDYWHVLYGIDVTLWAPFHVMIITGVMMVGLGTTFTLADDLHRSPHPAKGAAFTGTLALTAATLLLVLPDAAYTFGVGTLGGYTFTTYPVALALTLPAFLIAASRVSRLPYGATLFAAVMLALRLLIDATIPWLVEATRVAESLTYRPTAPDNVVSATYLPGVVLLSALAVDLTSRLAPQARWLPTVTVAAVTLTALLDQPWRQPSALPSLFPELDTTGLLLRAVPLTLAAAVLSVTWSGVLLRSYGVSTTGRAHTPTPSTRMPDGSHA